MADLMDKIIGLVVGLFVAGALLPSAISSLFDANTTGWSAEATTMWSTSGLLAVVGFAILIIYTVIKRRG